MSTRGRHHSCRGSWRLCSTSATTSISRSSARSQRHCGACSYATGPNQQFAPLGAYHPFDGDGMLHAVYLEDGKARYRNRWVESKGLLAERARGHALYGGMGSFQLTDPDAAREVGMMKNTGNTATVRHAGHLFTILEACAADGVRSRPQHPRRVRLRRSVAGADDGPPEGRSGQRRDAVLRIQPGGAVPALQRGGRRRRTRAQHRDRSAGAGDDARLRHHAEPCGLLRRAGGVRPRRGDDRRRSVELEARERHPDRHHPAAGHERGRAVVRDRQRLRRALLQRLGDRQHDRDPRPSHGGHARWVHVRAPAPPASRCRGAG